MCVILARLAGAGVMRAFKGQEVLHRGQRYSVEKTAAAFELVDMLSLLKLAVRSRKHIAFPSNPDV